MSHFLHAWTPTFVAAAGVTVLGVAGMMLTPLDAWYYNLRKPSWQPPNWLFGPVWTMIFGLAALAGVLYWRLETGREARLQILAAFALNAFLNTLWSLLFFRIKRPDLALDEVGLLWLSIILLIVLLRRRSAAAAWLLVPYVVWVSFAAYLNWTIVQLNAPLG